jgi:hypothetical protein
MGFGIFFSRHLARAAYDAAESVADTSARRRSDMFIGAIENLRHVVDVPCYFVSSMTIDPS